MAEISTVAPPSLSQRSTRPTKSDEGARTEKMIVATARTFPQRLGPQDHRKGARLRGQFGKQRSPSQLAFENDAKDGVEPGRPILAETCEPFPVPGVRGVVSASREETASGQLAACRRRRPPLPLDDAPMIENDDPAGDRPHHAHLVRDEHDGEAELAIDVAQERENRGGGLGSSADVASSDRRSAGSAASARAMPTRCFCPPESCAG